MFRCDRCNSNSVECFKVISKTKERVYYNLAIENFRKNGIEYKAFSSSEDRNKFKQDLKDSINRYTFKDWNTIGWEIVKEEKLCRSCHEK